MTTPSKHQIRETGQLRRAKLHIACLIGKRIGITTLTSTQCRSLETGHSHESGSSESFSAYFNHSPAIAQDELQKLRCTYVRNDKKNMPYLTQDEVAALDDDLN